MKDKLEKRISKIEKHLLHNLRSNKKFLATVFYLLSLLCIVYPILYYTLFVHDFFNPQSVITFSYMLIGMFLGILSITLLAIAYGIGHEKVKL